MTELEAALELARKLVAEADSYPAAGMKLSETSDLFAAAGICRALLALAAEHEQAMKVVEAAVMWRATPPCDGHGSSSTWVGALLGMERAIDTYRTSRERGK